MSELGDDAKRLLDADLRIIGLAALLFVRADEAFTDEPSYEQGLEWDRYRFGLRAAVRSALAAQRPPAEAEGRMLGDCEPVALVDPFGPAMSQGLRPGGENTPLDAPATLPAGDG